MIERGRNEAGLMSWPGRKPQFIVPAIASISVPSMKIQSLRLIAFRPFAALAALAVALATCPAHGAQDRYAGTPWALMDAKKALQAAREITLAKHPDCDDATIEQKLVEVYRADGTAESQDEAYVKVLTEKGKRSRRTMKLSFMLPYSTVEVARVEVIKPAGEIVPVDVMANSKETIDDSQMAMNIYDPNSKVLEVNIPVLEVGDIVHWVTRTTTLRPIIPGEFADENIFEGLGYIRHIEYEVHAPLDKPLKRIVLRDEVPGTVKYTTTPGDDHTLIHRWEVSNVPRMFPEPSMPSAETVLQRVLISTTPDWQGVSKWYWELSRPHLEATTTDLRNTVARLTAGAKSDMDKVKALFYYVSPKIRYMGLTPEKDRPGFEPHDVSTTYEKSYGVCRDKAALLVSMLRIAGLNAYPVLINVESKKDKDVPDAGFNHAIVGVELKKGAYTLMDPTDEHARDLLPAQDCDQSYLVARPEGEGLRTSPVNPPEENMMLIKTTGVLSAEGELQAKSEMSFAGANDDIYRNGFSHMKADDRQRFFERCLKQSMPGAKLTSLKITPANMLDVSSELKAEIEFTVEGMTATGNGKSVVSLPWVGNHLGAATFVLKGNGLSTRKYPLQTHMTCGLREDISLQLGAGFAGAESAPSYLPVDDPCVSYHQTFDAKNGTLTCSRELKLKADEFSPAQYAELKRTLKGMDYDARKTPVLAVAESGPAGPTGRADASAAPAVESNATILDSHKELHVIDAHSALYKVSYSKRILTYAGKIREAEVKVNFNPSCEEIRFLRGTVISKDGQRREISKGEINIMDAPWNASAKRYTGGKILVANLPGVDIGSTIEVEFEVATHGKPFLAGFESFQLPDDLQEKSFDLTAPATVKIEKLVTDSGPLETKYSAGRFMEQMYRWTAANAKALPAEPLLPPEWTWMPNVAYFAGDFKAYLKDLNDAFQNRSQSRAKVEARIHQLIPPGASKVEAVTAIRDFVAKSIRNAGPSFTDLPLSELSAADVTLADGYGHAADRAILLHAMLSAAGFQPEFVLASNLPAVGEIKNIAAKFPLPGSFNTPLVKVAFDGNVYYLNDTDQYAKLGSTPHEGKLGIALAGWEYQVIETAKEFQNKTETLYTLSVADDGKLKMGVTQRYYGEEYNKRNHYFSELLPEDRKRYFQELISHIAQGALPVGDLSTHFETYPGVEQFSVELDNYAVVDGKYLYFDLPSTPELFKLPMGGDRRSLPLMLSQHGTTTIRTEIELPPTFRNVVMSPKSQNLDAPSGGGKVRVQASSTPGKFVMTDELETSPAIISPKDYSSILKVDSALEKKSSKVFLLEKE